MSLGKQSTRSWQWKLLVSILSLRRLTPFNFHQMPNFPKSLSPQFISSQRQKQQAPCTISHADDDARQTTTTPDGNNRIIHKGIPWIFLFYNVDGVSIRCWVGTSRRAKNPDARASDRLPTSSIWVTKCYILAVMNETALHVERVLFVFGFGTTHQMIGYGYDCFLCSLS